MNKGVPRTRKKSVVSLDFSRDIYGFMVRPQHLEKYKEYASIYKEEEAERSDRWEHFLQAYNESSESFHQDQEYDKTSLSGIHLQDQTELKGATSHELGRQYSEIARSVQTWGQLRSSLWVVKQGLSRRPWKKASLFPLKPTENQLIHQANDEDSDDEFYDADRSDAVSDHQASDLSDSEFPNVTNKFEEESCSWREELQFLVRGGVPMALRGELWQVFVGTKERRIEGHYTALLKQSAQNSDDVAGLPNIEKWTNQIEKDLPRTFPGHPALDKDGRNALRRLLTAYARHNPDVGYCQAMNFFAALLLLLMPEENAFWTLTAIIGDYFEGYYSEKMMESQVDQLAFQDLVQEYFPKLASHLDMLGVQVACVSGPWFISIFVNVLPWESVLRVWDVLLFEGNRTMLFRTALALMDMHAPTLMSARDAGDAISLLQSTVGSTFDSSQLVLTACMGYQLVDQAKLEQLRTKHRPTVVATFHERALDLHLDIDEEQIDIIDLQEQVLWLKNELCRALEEKKAANLRAEELELALMEMVKEDNRRLLSAKIEELEDEVSSLREAINGKMEQEQAMVEVMLRMEQEQKVTEDARQFAEQDAEAQRHAANLLQQKYEEAMDALAAMEKRAVMAETMLEATLQYQALDIGQPNNRRLVSTPKEEEHLKKNWSLTSPRASDIEASKTTSPTSADMVNRSSSGSAPESPDESASRKQGLFSRISWRDKNKGRSGSPLSQNSEINSNGIVAKEIHQNGNGVHATEIEDVS